MKISQRQASLLAREIVSQLEGKNAFKIGDGQKKQIESFLNKRKALIQKKAEAQDNINRHDGTLVSVVGKGTKINPYDNLQEMVKKMEQKQIPSASEIEDEIILKSMFKSSEDLETFIQSIVKKYEKKLQSKALSN